MFPARKTGNGNFCPPGGIGNGIPAMCSDSNCCERSLMRYVSSEINAAHTRDDIVYATGIG